jgi:hypothetical protein
MLFEDLKVVEIVGVEMGEDEQTMAKEGICTSVKEASIKEGYVNEA